MAKDDITIITISFVNSTLFESRKTIVSANRLFRKWANIGTKMLSVLRYSTAMQTAKTKAENMDPKL